MQNGSVTSITQFRFRHRVARVAFSRLALVLIAGLTVVACGDGATEPAAQTVASVEVLPTAVTLVSLDGTVQLRATARDGAGNRISGKTFTWSSDDEDCATVDTSGLATAVGNGAASIMASVDGVSGSASITVQQEINSIVVAPIGVSVSGVGATQAFTAEPQDANGNPIPALPVIWTSLNPNVATIDDGGTATAVASGQATIAAEVDGQVSYALLTVCGVWGTSSSDVFAVGGFCCVSSEYEILHYDGTAWSTMTSGTTNDLNAVWGTSSTDVYAVGSGGAILHYDGAEWSPMASGTDGSLWGVWGTSTTDVYALAGGGTILRYDGTSWSTMVSGTPAGLSALWGTSSGDVFAVGSSGVIVRGSR